jgi:formylmethanofuran dehydrogenase subunit E
MDRIKNLNKHILAVLMVMLLAFVSAKAEDPTEGTKLLPIEVLEEGHVLKISLEEVKKYHGHICPNVLSAYRATQLAISELWGDETPKREDFRIISANPGDCPKDVFEFITRAVTRGDFLLEVPKEHSDVSGLLKHHPPISPDCFRFTFIRKSNSDSVTIQVRKEVFPKDFHKLLKKAKIDKTATPEEGKLLKQAGQDLVKRLMKLPLDKAFSVRKGEVEGTLYSVAVMAERDDQNYIIRNEVINNELMVKKSEDSEVEILDFDDSIMEMHDGEEKACLCRSISYRIAQICSQAWDDGVFRSYEIEKITSGWNTDGVKELFVDILEIPDDKLVFPENVVSPKNATVKDSWFEIELKGGRGLIFRGTNRIYSEKFLEARRKIKAGDQSVKAEFMKGRKNTEQNLRELPFRDKLIITEM